MSLVSNWVFLWIVLSRHDGTTHRNGRANSFAGRVNLNQIAHMSDEALESWIQYMQDALEGEDKSLARRVIQQFVTKIVIKEGTGTLYYRSPFPNDPYMLSIETWT